MVWTAFMTQDEKDVVLKIGTWEECRNVIDSVSGTPGISKIGMIRIRDGQREKGE
jgi:hypothetical protein